MSEQESASVWMLALDAAYDESVDLDIRANVGRDRMVDLFTALRYDVAPPVTDEQLSAALLFMDT